ncbi:protein FAM217B [Microcaecilia unicolor]|uniref:Protein FAM217B n=1 Tax=Microcaecilia unicolor TaxID=1415580 RepID=A0A6P7YTW7_9AMPH|nr:protein FAM217B [Microcaecilia unicolor]
MGPDIPNCPPLLDRAIKKTEGQSQGNNTRMVISKREKGHPETKASKEPVPQLRSSPSKPGNNLPNSTKKVFQSSLRHVQRSYTKKEKNGINGSHQQNRIMNAHSSAHKIQESKKVTSEKKLSESVSQKKISSSLRGSSLDDPRRTEATSLQNSYLNKKAGSEILRNVTEVGCYPSQGTRQMFLDFESIRIIKEEADEDSASDLSDSERIPIPPSPFTPPDLNLRAEKIDPGSFDHLFELGYKESEYYYPDFLPPPFNSWDLHQLAIFINTEGKHAPRPPPAGFLEKYVDRLLHLEWLQIQTTQNEKGKAVRSRPQSASSSSRCVRSPGKSKCWHNQASNKQLVHPESLSKLPPAQTSNQLRKDLHCEAESSQLYVCQRHARADDATGDTSYPQNHMHSVIKKKTENKKPQLLEVEACKYSPKLQSASNIRPPKQSLTFHSPSAPLKGLKTYVYINAKKNGTASNCHTPVKRQLPNES